MRAIRGFYTRHKAGSVLAALLVVCVISMAATGSTVAVRPKQIGFGVVSLAQRGVAGLGSFFSGIVNSIGELRRLRSNYDELQTRLLQMKVDERELVQLRAEIRRLKEQLDFSESLGYEFVAAEVIGRDPGNVYNTIVVSKGAIHGVSRNMPVVAYSGGLQGLVGRVIEVGPVSSLVLPLYDAGCFVPARTQESRITGLVSGSGDMFAHLLMASVPKSARDSLKVGDLVVTSGLSSIYPRGIYVGRIREIGAKTWETSLQIGLEPIVDFSRLEYVFVIKTAEGSL